MPLNTGFRASLVMDNDQQSLGNSAGDDGRGQLHVKAFGGGILNGRVYTSGTVAYPDNITEIYTLLNGGLSGVLVATVTLVYTNSTKQFLASFDTVYPP
jgi:hypothetical protein